MQIVGTLKIETPAKQHNQSPPSLQVLGPPGLRSYGVLLSAYSGYSAPGPWVGTENFPNDLSAH
jgi:hypothetical protein